MTPAEQTGSRPAQAPSQVVMVRPHRFSVNAATAGDNAFQRPAARIDGETARAAYDDVTRLAGALRQLRQSSTTTLRTVS